MESVRSTPPEQQWQGYLNWLAANPCHLKVYLDVLKEIAQLTDYTQREYEYRLPKEMRYTIEDINTPEARERARKRTRSLPVYENRWFRLTGITSQPLGSLRFIQIRAPLMRNWILDAGYTGTVRAATYDEAMELVRIEGLAVTPVDNDGNPVSNDFDLYEIVVGKQHEPTGDDE